MRQDSIDLNTVAIPKLHFPGKSFQCVENALRPVPAQNCLINCGHVEVMPSCAADLFLQFEKVSALLHHNPAVHDWSVFELDRRRNS